MILKRKSWESNSWCKILSDDLLQMATQQREDSALDHVSNHNLLLVFKDVSIPSFINSGSSSHHSLEQM